MMLNVPRTQRGADSPLLWMADESRTVMGVTRSSCIKHARGSLPKGWNRMCESVVERRLCVLFTVTTRMRRNDVKALQHTTISYKSICAWLVRTMPTATERWRTPSTAACLGVLRQRKSCKHSCCGPVCGRCGAAGRGTAFSDYHPPIPRDIDLLFLFCFCFLSFSQPLALVFKIRATINLRTKC